MTKADLIEKVQQEKPDLSKKAASDLLDTIFENISKAVKKDRRFSYPGFGTFTLTERAARKGRNPRTGEEIKIKKSKTVKFKPAPQFKSGL